MQLLAALRTRAAISADAYNETGWHQPCNHTVTMHLGYNTAAN